MLQTNQEAATRVLSLLLDNAKKFTHPAEAKQGRKPIEGGAEVVLKVATDGTTTTFVVEDTGIGVPVEEDGTGIGLTVARSLSRRIGGDVVLDTTYTHGARFIFSLS